MKRKKQYPDKVIGYALAQRGNRAKWKEIQDGIRREFGMRPPSERQMREWCKEFGGEPNDPESILRQTLIETAKASTPWAAFTTQKFAIEQVSTIVDAWKRREEPWMTMGIILVSLFEEMFGTDNFDKILRTYEEGKIQRNEKRVGWLNLSAAQRMAIPYPMHVPLKEAKSDEVTAPPPGMKPEEAGEFREV